MKLCRGAIKPWRSKKPIKIGFLGNQLAMCMGWGNFSDVNQGRGIGEAADTKIHPC